MSDAERISELVGTYEREYRNPERAKRYPFVTNRLYDLPKEWKTTSFPDADGPGVYVFYDEDEKLSYVGKASWSNTLGNRIASYFKSHPEQGIVPRSGHSWKRMPRYVQTISVQQHFEAPSLEEFLISELEPVDNSLK